MKTLRAEAHNEAPFSIPDFCIERRVLNNTERGIYLYGREGYVAYIEPTYNPNLPKGIYFNTEVRSKGQVKTDASSILIEKDSNERPSGARPRLRVLEGFTRVREDLLDTSSSKLHYITDHDIALGFREPTQFDVHPFSREGTVDYVTDGERKREANGALDITIDIVDNEGTFGDRYLNVGGTAFAIRARKDPTLSSGIYAGWTNEIRVNGSPMVFGRRLFPFEELEKSVFPFTLYKTPEEAQGIDPSKRFEMELNESKTKLDLLKHERDEVSLARKDFYEERSFARKDSSDGWKMLPAFVLGVATLVKLIF